MPRSELEALFLESLATIDKVLSALTRRHQLSGDEASEFIAWAKFRIIDGDYAVLAKFRGESSIQTYFVVVFSMLFREYRVREWGRWRPSAAARRGGPTVIKLEQLTHRDGLPLRHAGELLRTSGETRLTDSELGRVLSALPSRAPQTTLRSSDLPLAAAANETAEDLVRDHEQAADTTKVHSALTSAISQLSAEDRLIVRLHFIEGVSIADVARGLSLAQKPLYPRIQRLLVRLRQVLEESGISRDQISELITDNE